MARIILGIAGAAIGAVSGGSLLGVSAAMWGAAIGSTIGGLIDNVLFPPPSVEGPRLDDLSVTTSTYGTPIPLVYGPQVRISGNVIESSGLIEHVTETEGGKKGKSGPTQRTYEYTITFAIALCEGPVEGVVKRIWMNRKLVFDLSKAIVPLDPPTPLVGMVAARGGFFDKNKGGANIFGNGTHTVFSTLRFYQGNGTQQIDPTLEMMNGVGNQQAYRHTCYAVIEDLALADFGNALPYAIEFEIEAHSSISAGAVARDICRRAGVPLVSASQVTDQVQGLVIARGGSATAAIQPLMLAYDFDAVEQRGDIRFIKRGRAPKCTIPIGDMGAVAGSLDPPNDPINFERMSEQALPTQATVTYSDPALNFQVNSQKANRRVGNKQNILEHEVPLVLSAAAARGIADRLLWEAHAARRGAIFRTSRQYSRLNAGDVITIPVAGEAMPHKLVRLTHGADGVMEFEGRYEDIEIYLPIAAAANPVPVEQVFELPGPTGLILMDAPIAKEADDDSGFYWAVGATNNAWRGAIIIYSTDGGANYTIWDDAGVPAIVGKVAEALPSGPTALWDYGNVLRVTLLNDEHSLSSVSEELVFSGRNAAWLGPANGQGGEVLKFRDATLVSPGVYDLSGLLRGRFGTEYAVGAHQADEVFVLYNRIRWSRRDDGVTSWNRDRLFKPVTLLTSSEDTPAQSFTNTGEGKRPLSPVHVAGIREHSGSPQAPGDLTITWHRRSRIPGPGLGYGPLPLGEETEAYEIDVMDGPDVVRTLFASSESVVYTDAQQIEDGITPGDPVTVRVYQMSALRGRGHPAEATV